MAFASKFLSSHVALQTALEKNKSIHVDSTFASYLNGIFIHVDTDNDGYITTSQLSQALKFIGVTPREALLKKYTDLMNQKSRRGSSSTSRMSISNQISTKIDLITFVGVTSGELDKVKQASADIDPLLHFMAMDNKSDQMVSIHQLHHLLVDTLSPTRLDTDEFRAFIDALGIPATKLQTPHDECISVAELKKKLVLHC